MCRAKMCWGSTLMHTRSDEIVQIAKTLIGLKYRHQGRGKGSIDCVGVPIYIAQELGLSSWDTMDYGPRPDLHRFNQLIIETGAKRIPLRGLSHGDMVQVSWEGSAPVHVGIMEIDERGYPWIIHAFMPHRKVTRDPVDAKMQQSFVAAWRLPE